MRQASQRLRNRLVEEGKAYRDFTPKEQRDDKDVKQGIADRARAQTAEGVDPAQQSISRPAKRGIRPARGCAESRLLYV